ncbi:hypothetical protein [Pedobacter frigiditerrae]|uniref:hypothetical protein n=1 Tax=Pedobacter frigiditerrae TaxID=2530452 RepID=UPI00292E20FB|nr:hypothetical protein [Pedobacter frigiditerrae]
MVIKKFISVILTIALITIDLFIYIILGVGLMSYEDTYTPSKGEYYSWASMSDFDKALVIGFNIWNIVNVIAILYIGYFVYKKVRSEKMQAYGNNQNNHR